MLPGILPHKKTSFLLVSLKPNIMRTILLEGKASGPKSIFWSPILRVKDILHGNCIYQIHKGKTCIWSQPWCHIWSNIHDHVNLPILQNPLPKVVADLWHIADTFSHDATNAILQVPTICSQENNILTWKPATKGTCTTRGISFPKFATAGTTANNGQHNLFDDLF